jgi:hypothetical protein
VRTDRRRIRAERRALIDADIEEADEGDDDDGSDDGSADGSDDGSDADDEEDEAALAPLVPTPRVPAHVRATLDAIAARHPRHQKMKLEWLLFFGVAAADVLQLKRALHALPRSGTPYALLHALRRRSARAFAVVYHFFAAGLARASYYEIEGDAAMYVHQALAVARKYGPREGAPFPAVAGRVQVCMNCEDPKQVSFYPPRFKHKHSCGKGRCCVTGDGVVVCARRPKRRNWREEYLRLNGELPPAPTSTPDKRWTPETAHRKRAKTLHTMGILARCKKTPTATLDARGRVPVLFGTPYLMCFVCARVDPHHYFRHVADRLMCRECAATARAALAMEAAARAGANRCAHCAACVSEAGLPRPAAPPGAPTPVVWQNGFAVELYDDVAAEAARGWRRVWFCASAHGSLAWVRRDVVRLSVALRGIAEQWGKTSWRGRGV